MPTPGEQREQRIGELAVELARVDEAVWAALEPDARDRLRTLAATAVAFLADSDDTDEDWGGEEDVYGLGWEDGYQEGLQAGLHRRQEQADRVPAA